jgi:hypothetical protein
MWRLVSNLRQRGTTVAKKGYDTAVESALFQKRFSVGKLWERPLMPNTIRRGSVIRFNVKMDALRFMASWRSRAGDLYALRGIWRYQDAVFQRSLRGS